MTSTPESWDDVGCLRIQVDSISQKVEDLVDFQQGQAASYGFHESQIQKLTDELKLIQAQQQEHEEEKCQMKLMIAQHQKEKCHIKVCGIITAVLLVLVIVVLALHILMAGNDLVPRLIHRLSDEPWKTHLGDFTFKSFEAATASPVVLSPNVSSDLGLHRPGLSEVSVTSAQVLHEREPMNEVVAKRQLEEAPFVDADLDKDDNDKGFKEAKQDGDAHQPGEELGDIQEAINAIQVKPSALTDDRLASPHTKFHSQSQQLYGIFWVCFPSSSWETHVKKYAPVFTNVAKNWTMYPFCYLDTSMPELYEEHFCDEAIDNKQIVFNMQKSRKYNIVGNQRISSPKGSGEIPTNSWFNECGDLVIEPPVTFKIESPVWFRRMFQLDEDIQTSLVEKFLNDVHSGHLPEFKPPKGIGHTRDL